MNTENTTTVDGVALEQGVVYLRDRRNGRVYQYEELLSQMGHIEKFLYEGKVPDRVTLDTPGQMKVNTTALERAADWDRLAAMKPEEREAELEKRAAYEAEQRKLSERVEQEADKQGEKTLPPAQPNNEYADEQIELLDKQGPTLKAYRENKWTNELLVEKGLAKAK